MLCANGLELAYDEFGDASALPILLIAGLGTQMIRWTSQFCEGLLRRGFRIIRFDNRDSGQSTHFRQTPPPDLAALMRGESPYIPYTLDDMAADAIGVLDALEIERAHLVGRSMGGMIAQVVAAGHPERVLSLTSIMATSGNPALPAPAPDVMAMMMGPTPDPSREERAFVDHRVAFARRIATPDLPFDESEHRALVLAELHRGWEAGASGRQIGAIAADGDRRARLSRVTAPALVIHGSADPLFPLPHGRDTAAAIPDARFLPLEGMGHDLPTAFCSMVVDAIAEIASKARPRLLS
jgi:pimeloyl-ACP methyl ester carboxylesterase